ncbi:MAG: IS1380 family transposase [Planctomycetota bacterium]
MATECTSGGLLFQGVGRREIRADFNGGDITSDAGVLLLQEVEQRCAIIEQFAHCFEDHRDARRVEHGVRELVAQRIFAIALGYEDLNDHDDLRFDPLLATAVGSGDPKGSRRRRDRDRGAGLAGKSTLNRIELSRPEEAVADRYRRIVLHEELADQVLLDLFVQAHPKAPKQIILDLDATDDPVHGKQEGRFFHGFYGCYCYLPLYIFCGDHLLCARLREADIDASAGSVDELERIVEHLRKAWPKVRILVRADSGFCREEIMAWCEDRRVDFVFGLARNPRLERRIAKRLREARRRSEEIGKPVRFFEEFDYRTRQTWSRARRVVGKAEHIPGRSNPRFVVTSLGRSEADKRQLYEDIYCARGEMENRIKEQQLHLFADRTSSSSFRANQTRLYFSSIAYVLLEALRRIGLRGTDMAEALCGTIRTKLLKIGARIRVTVRKIWVAMAQACPYAQLFRRAVANLRS